MAKKTKGSNKKGVGLRVRVAHDINLGSSKSFFHKNEIAVVIQDVYNLHPKGVIVESLDGKRSSYGYLFSGDVNAVYHFIPEDMKEETIKVLYGKA